MLTQYFPPERGAAQVRLLFTAKGLQKRGFDVRVVSAMPNYPSGRVFPAYRGHFYLQEEIMGIPTARLWIKPATGRNAIARLMSYCSFTLSSLVGLFKSQVPDVLLVESPPLFLVLSAWVYSNIVRVPFIMNVSDLWPDSVRELGIMTNRRILSLGERLERFAYRQAKQITAVTQGMLTTLREQKQVPSDKLLFLPNGVDTDVFNPHTVSPEVRERYGAIGKRVVAYTGTCGVAHGVRVVLDAARILSNRNDILFLIVGDGSEKAALRAYAREQNMTNVRFHDPVPPSEVAEILAMSDMALVTLRDCPLFEGTRPAKMFPAMASGKPIIYSGKGEGARLVEEFECGLVTDPQDAGQLAAMIERLVDDPTLGIRLGLNGRAAAMTHFTWDAIVSKWVDDLCARIM